jgi:hypothetical protein
MLTDSLVKRCLPDATWVLLRLLGEVFLIGVAGAERSVVPVVSGWGVAPGTP